MSPPKTPRQPLAWPLLPLPDEYGRLAWPSLEESVRHSIEAVLSTRPGELLMRPHYGAGLPDLRGVPNSLETRTRIRDLVRATLERWEPRIDVDQVEAAEVAGAPSRVNVTIAYRLRRTGASQSLALSLQLGT